MGLLEEEFWWMPLLALPIEGKVRVAVDEGGERRLDWPPVHDVVPLIDLADWVSDHDETNVHRRMVIERDAEEEAPVCGPFLVDVDIDGLEDGEQPSDLQVETARNITLAAYENYLANGLPADHLRIYFSGHKGFHVEVVFVDKPEEFHWSRRGYDSELKRLRNAAGRSADVVIDPFGSSRKEYLRINNTINKWPDGSRRHRMIQLTKEELRSLSPADLWNRSKVD